MVLAAGDIACDPTDASYNGGAGTASACQQLAISNELSGAVAVLPLGDTQYYSATLSQFQIALNSECMIVAGGCAAGSPQEQWLKADLAAHSNRGRMLGTFGG